jgi:CDP-glycerol glycerophosphotransferase
VVFALVNKKEDSMRTAALISVIIPVNNVETYLTRCLESIANQTYGRLEVICIDDGSSDNSIKILQKFASKDKRFQVIRQKNHGVAMTRNKGIAIATGDYIHFMDADDMIDEDYYEMMLAAAESTNSDVAVSGMEEEGERTIIYKSSRVIEALPDKFRYTMAFFRGFCWRYLIRRDFLIENHLQFPKRIILEDLLFVIEMLRLAKRIVTVPKTMYHYLINPMSCLRRTDADHVARIDAGYKEAWMEVRKFSEKYGLKKIRRRHWYNKLPFFGYAKKKRIIIK